MSLLGLKFHASVMSLKHQAIQMSFKRARLVNFLKALLKFHSKMEKGRTNWFDAKQKHTGSYCLLSQRFSIYSHYGMSSYFGHGKILKQKELYIPCSYSCPHRPEPSAWDTADAQQVLAKET